MRNRTAVLLIRTAGSLSAALATTIVFMLLSVLIGLVLPSACRATQLPLRVALPRVPLFAGRIIRKLLLRGTGILRRSVELPGFVPAYGWSHIHLHHEYICICS